MAGLKEQCVCISVATNWGENDTRSSEMLEVAFWREDTSFWELLQVWKWYNLCWRCWILGDVCHLSKQMRLLIKRSKLAFKTGETLCACSNSLFCKLFQLVPKKQYFCHKWFITMFWELVPFNSLTPQSSLPWEGNSCWTTQYIPCFIETERFTVFSLELRWDCRNVPQLLSLICVYMFSVTGNWHFFWHVQYYYSFS